MNGTSIDALVSGVAAPARPCGCNQQWAKTSRVSLETSLRALLARRESDNSRQEIRQREGARYNTREKTI